jgi:hypothetical protein
MKESRMPDLHDLDHFHEGLPAMDLLPATEIRRQGDRMRRRRAALVAGGVLAGAVAIGTPVLAFSGSGGGTKPDSHVATSGPSTEQTPTPTPTPTVPPAGWLTAVPDGFPLTAGFADETAEASSSLDGDPAVPAGCGTSFEGYTDSLVATYQGESENRALRYLVVYPDAAAAREAMSQARSAVAACGTQAISPDTTRIHGVVDAVDLGTDEAYALTEQVRHDDGLISELSLAVVGRTGNAVYIDYSFGSVGGDRQVSDETARLVARSGQPVQALCAFAVEPCLG